MAKDDTQMIQELQGNVKAISEQIAKLEARNADRNRIWAHFGWQEEELDHEKLGGQGLRTPSQTLLEKDMTTSEILARVKATRAHRKLKLDFDTKTPAQAIL